MVKLTNFGHLTTEIPQFWLWSWSKRTNFDHLTTAISKYRPWSWSKIFDHLTMTPGRRPNGQKFMVILPPLINLLIYSSVLDMLLKCDVCGKSFKSAYELHLHSANHSAERPYECGHCGEYTCIVLYCIVLYCIVLYCIVLYCIVLYCILMNCLSLYCIVLYCIVLYCILMNCLSLHCIVLYCIVLYCTY